MFTVNDLTIKKDENDYVVSDGDRSFIVNAKTLQPSKDWFCSYETIKKVLLLITADVQISVSPVQDDG